MEGRSAASSSAFRLHVKVILIGDVFVCMLILSFAVRSLSYLANLPIAFWSFQAHLCRLLMTPAQFVSIRLHTNSFHLGMRRAEFFLQAKCVFIETSTWRSRHTNLATPKSNIGPYHVAFWAKSSPPLKNRADATSESQILQVHAFEIILLKKFH
jgi:hypothetical protein